MVPTRTSGPYLLLLSLFKRLYLFVYVTVQTYRIIQVVRPPLYVNDRLLYVNSSDDLYSNLNRFANHNVVL